MIYCIVKVGKDVDVDMISEIEGKWGTRARSRMDLRSGRIVLITLSQISFCIEV